MTLTVEGASGSVILYRHMLKQRRRYLGASNAAQKKTQ